MDQAVTMARLAIEALEEKKGEDIRVIDISDVSTLADYFIIVSGSNPNQVHALADSVDEKLGKAGFNSRQTEGYHGANWILMDYRDLIIHIFSTEDRRFYDLERIWRDGRNMTSSEFMEATRQ